MKACVLCVAVALIAAGCVSRRPAPVADRSPERVVPPSAPFAVKPPAGAPEARRTDVYTVKPGDTLYSIAREHGIDHRDLAAWNELDNMAVIRTGQQLRLTPPTQMSTVTAAPLKTPGGKVESRPLGPPTAGAAGGAASVPATPSVPPRSAAAPSPEVIKTQPKGIRLPYSDEALAQFAKQGADASPKPESVEQPQKAEKVPDTKASVARGPDAGDWVWPTSGKVVDSFNGTTNKGIDIAGRIGQSIVASAAGRVIFSGVGIPQLGKFVVIQHKNDYISVYANNRELLVKQGQTITQGQAIAQMGGTGTTEGKLHFEIRRFSKPVDPLKLLPERGAAG